MPFSIYGSCFAYIHTEYINQENKLEWLRSHTELVRHTTTDDGKPLYKLKDILIMRIIKHGFTEEFKINMFQKKGHTQLQELITSEIEHKLVDIQWAFGDWFMKHHKVKSYHEILYPAPTGTPTEIEAIQCFICATNKKDRALPCGHSYCCCCVETMPNGKCPECNTVFDKSKVIKLYL